MPFIDSSLGTGIELEWQRGSRVQQCYAFCHNVTISLTSDGESDRDRSGPFSPLTEVTLQTPRVELFHGALSEGGRGRVPVYGARLPGIT